MTCRPFPPGRDFSVLKGHSINVIASARSLNPRTDAFVPDAHILRRRSTALNPKANCFVPLLFRKTSLYSTSENYQSAIDSLHNAPPLALDLSTPNLTEDGTFPKSQFHLQGYTSFRQDRTITLY